ncbi:MAG: dihydrolipoamide acetyltransferase family protein [Anaerolineae bacterium]|jgi:pyruvate dehydrogenase E2 component (dihydrolipoamide acetyltransferase)
MITEVILPKLGQTMEEGAIVEWVKKEGDPVKRGDLLFTVESDKAVLEVESTARGFLRRILVPEGQVVPVLTTVALITRQADQDISSYGAPTAPAEAAAPATTEARPAVSTAAADIAPPSPAAGRIFASPRARKTAREKGVDLALVSGTGPKGRIVEQDVLDYLASQPKATPMAQKTAETLGVDLATVTGTGVSGRIMQADVAQAAPAAVAPAPPAAEAVERQPMTGLRRIIAERMAASDAATARVTLVTEADATSFVEGREQLKASVAEEWGFAPGYNDLLGLIVARALREFPYMNARLGDDGQSIERLPDVNLGMAVDTERGLLVPVIRRAEQMGLRAFGTEFRALMERARAGKSLPDDLSGGTFTITNLGMYEIDAFTPIINLPEAAILGVGRILPKAVVRDGEIVARQMWTLSLVFDHRLVDGAPAARFLQRIKQLVENPFLLLG